MRLEDFLYVLFVLLRVSLCKSIGCVIDLALFCVVLVTTERCAVTFFEFDGPGRWLLWFKLIWFVISTTSFSSSEGSCHGARITDLTFSRSTPEYGRNQIVINIGFPFTALRSGAVTAREFFQRVTNVGATCFCQLWRSEGSERLENSHAPGGILLEADSSLTLRGLFERRLRVHRARNGEQVRLTRGIFYSLSMPFGFWGSNNASCPVESTAQARRSPTSALSADDYTSAEEDPTDDLDEHLDDPKTESHSSTPPLQPEGSFNQTSSVVRLKPPVLQFSVISRPDSAPPCKMVTEPPPDASAAEVEDAYHKASAELRQLESELPTCSTPDRKRKKLTLQLLQGLTQRLLTRHLHHSTTGELDSRVSRLSEKHDELSSTVETVREMAMRAEKLAKRGGSNNAEFRDELDFLQAGYHQMRRVIEQLDQKQRKKNVIVVGAERGVPHQVAERLLGDRQDLLRNLDEAFFLGKGQGRKPLLISFITVKAAEECLRFSHANPFVQRFPHVRMVRDRSDLRRTGTSRLAAAAYRVKEQFPTAAVHKHYDYVEVGGKRLDAFDFAASAVVINDSLFDIDAACNANDEYEMAEGVFTRVGDIIVFGFRKKGVGGVRYSEEDDDEPSSAARGASAATGATSAAKAAQQKRMLAGINTASSGEVQLFDGTNRYAGQNINLSLIGSTHDPYEVRGT